MKRLLHNLIYVLSITVLSFGAVPFLGQDMVDAAVVDNRYIDIESAAPNVITNHNFGFTLISANPIGSIEFEYCSNNPFPGDPCTVPADLNLLGASLDNQTGETGFTVHASTTANRMVITRTAAAPTPGPVTYRFINVNNTSEIGSQYVRIGVFQTEDGTGPRTDHGGVAYATEDLFSVSSYVPPYLEFCVGITITANNCATATGNIVNMGDFDNTYTSFGTSQMTAATNDGNGYTITANGPTMTSGNNTIPAMSNRNTSNIGSSQFGINLRNNSNPDVGSNVVGPGVAFPTNDYNFVNQYKYRSGEVIARSNIESHYRTFTVSYIVNINQNQSPGQYATTFTYIATATF